MHQFVVYGFRLAVSMRPIHTVRYEVGNVSCMLYVVCFARSLTKCKCLLLQIAAHLPLPPQPCFFISLMRPATTTFLTRAGGHDRWTQGPLEVWTFGRESVNRVVRFSKM